MQTVESIADMYRDAWSRFATGVTVVTTVDPSGAVHGMTASSVTSVSLDPPLVLAVIGDSRQTHALIENTGRFGMSILDAGQTEIATHFATPPESRGALDGEKLEPLSETTVIANAISAMDCKRIATHKGGRHTDVFREVQTM